MSEVTLEKLAARVDAMRELLVMLAITNVEPARDLMCNALEATASKHKEDSAYALELARLAEDVRHAGRHKDGGQSQAHND